MVEVGFEGVGVVGVLVREGKVGSGIVRDWELVGRVG